MCFVLFLRNLVISKFDALSFRLLSLIAYFTQATNPKPLVTQLQSHPQKYTIAHLCFRANRAAHRIV
jgi:hypothetical protein